MHVGWITVATMLAVALVAPALPLAATGNLRLDGHRVTLPPHGTISAPPKRRLGRGDRPSRYYLDVVLVDGEVPVRKSVDGRGRGGGACATADDHVYTAESGFESYASVGAVCPPPIGASHGAAWGGSSAPPMVYSPSAAPMPRDAPWRCAHRHARSPYRCR